MGLLNIRERELERNGKLLFKIKNIMLNDGDIVGIIGKNGSGKTTLLREIFEDISVNKNYRNSIDFLTFNEDLNLEKSGGEMVVQKILEHFAIDKKIYLLDEPTTYLDQNNMNKITNLIKRKNSIFCIASHDRSFLEKICTKLWIIENEELVEFSGTYQEYISQRKIRINEYSSELKKYQKEKKKLRESIRGMKEEQQAKKKGKPKNMSASDYRISGVKTKISQNQKKMQKNIAKQEEKLGELLKPKKIEEDYDISFLDIFSKRSRKTFYTAQKEFFINDNLLWKVSNLTFQSGDKVMLVGKNGSGKTTFLNYLKTQIPTNYKVAYFEQNNLEIFNKDETLLDFIRSFTDIEEIKLRNILALLNFRGKDVNKKLHVLSNGEKVKLYFISLLFQETDVLLLDEITNFLDIVTIEAVENILEKYPGILIMVSHDKKFVENVATKVIEFNKGNLLKVIF